MSHDEVLARCLADIEQGAAIDECLARYPDYADELKPLLQLVTQLSPRPRPEMSPAAFARGRVALAAQARYHQSLHEPFQAASSNGAINYPTPGAQPPRRVAPLVPPPARPFLLARRLTNALIAALLVVSLLTLTRQIRTSLPNSSLYPAKIFVENLQGYLMVAAGQRALWHARQVEWRLYELDQLARLGETNAALEAAVETNAISALTASASLPTEERTRFLEIWLGELEEARPETTQITTIMTLGRVIAAVETAADGGMTPTVLPVVAPPAAATPVPAETPTINLLPTVSPTAATGPSANNGRVLLPTPTPTPILVTAPAFNPLPATAAATTAPPAFAATVPAPPVVEQLPRTDEQDTDDGNDAPAPATNTPVRTAPAPTNTSEPPTATFTLPPPTPTWTPAPSVTPVPTSTARPITTASATAAEPTNTPSDTRPTTTPTTPGATPSPAGTTPASGTNTPLPIESTTPNPTATIPATATPTTANPTATSWLTPLPLPTRITEATPAPSNTAAPTPVPDTATPLHTATQPEPIAPTEEPTREATATPQPTFAVVTPTPDTLATSSALPATATPTRTPRKRN
jgi:hypothetical protein